jgi:hypothetical protein
VAQRENAPSPPARPADVESLDAIIHAVYDVISGPAGARDWDRFRSLFAPGARLIPVAPAGPPGTAGSSQMRAHVIDVEGFVTRAGEAVAKEAFFEREIARKVHQYGDIAEVFSTYESRHDANGQPFARGINSIQAYQGGGRWWIVTIFWEAEAPERPIPREYLP